MLCEQLLYLLNLHGDQYLYPRAGLKLLKFMIEMNANMYEDLSFFNKELVFDKSMV